MSTRNKLLTESREAFAAAGVPATSKEVEWLLIEAASISAIDLVSTPDAEVTPSAEKTFRSFVKRRLNREPVQYILGHTEFFGHRFAVDSSVLIPRPETEQLVERALALAGAGVRLLDLGTGSGCIAISFEIGSPGSRVTAVDISRDALNIARKNAVAHGSEIEWIHGDFFDERLIGRVKATFAGGRADLIVSNPPYVLREEEGALEAEVVAHEPHIALFAQKDELAAYRALCRIGHSLLEEGGTLLAEIHTDLGSEVNQLFADGGYTEVYIHVDLAGKDRVLEARI